MRHVVSTHLLSAHRLNTVWLERIREAGADGVEIFCARQHFDYTNREQVAELGYWFRDATLQLHSLHAPMFNDDCWGRTGPGSVISITATSKPKRLAAVDEIKRALEVAEIIPFRYLIQHLGVSGEDYDEHKLDAAFTALEDLMLFARHRGVEILLENIPNGLSTAERLLHFLQLTQLDLHFCLDTGHANLDTGLEAAFGLMQDRLRSTHVHDNDGHEDRHLAPLLAAGGTIDWARAMTLLRSRRDQYPLLLELREAPEYPNPLAMAREVFQRLEAL
jgi:sugar phosphate isomerase/epimerase